MKSSTTKAHESGSLWENKYLFEQAEQLQQPREHPESWTKLKSLYLSVSQCEGLKGNMNCLAHAEDADWRGALSSSASLGMHSGPTWDQSPGP